MKSGVILGSLLAAIRRRVRRRSRQPPALGAEAILYAPRFSPWLDPDGFARLYERIRHHTLVDAERCYVLHTLARQALHIAGEFWECGVYQGGTASLLADVVANTGRTLRLFDTFSGMPPGRKDFDWHQEGDFADTSLPTVRQLVAYDGAVFHQGVIPESFAGLGASRIAFAHVDVDLYQSVLDSSAYSTHGLPPEGSLSLTTTVGQAVLVPDTRWMTTFETGRRYRSSCPQVRPWSSACLTRTTVRARCSLAGLRGRVTARVPCRPMARYGRPSSTPREAGHANVDGRADAHAPTDHVFALE